MNLARMLVGAAIGIGVGYSGLPNAESRILIAQPRQPPTVDTHGAELDVSAELVPEAIVNRGGTESLEARLRLSNGKKVGLRSLTALEVVSDRGVRFVTPTTLPPSAVAATAEVRTLVAIPPALTDGYYRAHARTAVIWDDGTEGGTRADLYFKVEESQIYPMDLEAWFLEADVRGDLPKNGGSEP